MVKGARQVGKTWALREFGRTRYRNCVYVSLEEIAPGVPSRVRPALRADEGPSEDPFKHRACLRAAHRLARPWSFLTRYRIVPLRSGRSSTFATMRPSITWCVPARCLACGWPAIPPRFRWGRWSFSRCSRSRLPSTGDEAPSGQGRSETRAASSRTTCASGAFRGRSHTMIRTRRRATSRML